MQTLNATRDLKVVMSPTLTVLPSGRDRSCEECGRSNTSRCLVHRFGALDNHFVRLALCEDCEGTVRRNEHTAYDRVEPDTTHPNYYQRPQGVVDAERLATHEGDTALFKQLRADLLHRDGQIVELQANIRAADSEIKDLTADVAALSSRPPVRTVHTYWVANGSHVTVGELMHAIEIAESMGGSDAQFRPVKKDGRFVGLELSVSMQEEAA